MKNFLFSEVEESTTLIDGMAAGEFMDMLGRVIAFKEKDLPTYVDNTKKALATTVDKNGTLVGFPIDSMGHDHNVAAGWIKDVKLSEDGRAVIQFLVEFNDLGKSLISSNQMRYFSPEVDFRALVIRGGSLTNWPATRTKEQELLLKPVALSEAMFSLDGESLDERVNAIRDSFYETYAEFDWSTWPVEVFDSYLICFKDDKYWQVKYSIGEDGEVAFDTQDAWVEVKRQWVEVALESLKRVFSGLFRKASETNSDLEDVMKFEELTPEQKDKLLSEARTQVVAQMSTDKAVPELAALIDARAKEMFNSALAFEQRKAHVAQFAARVVGGTTEEPAGIPVDQESLEAYLLSIPEDKQVELEKMLEKIRQDGVIAFSELGHNKETNGNRELPAEIKLSLQKFVDAGYTKEEFFKVNAAELGNMSDYNLSEFEKKEN